MNLSRIGVNYCKKSVANMKKPILYLDSLCSNGTKSGKKPPTTFYVLTSVITVSNQRIPATWGDGELVFPSVVIAKNFI